MSIKRKILPVYKAIIIDNNKETIINLVIFTMSDYPIEKANNSDWGDEWVESTNSCPVCKDVLMWESGWYDDTPSSGGQCIGTQSMCGKCNYQDSR